jgi:hypothetical protein
MRAAILIKFFLDEIDLDQVLKHSLVLCRVGREGRGRPANFSLVKHDTGPTRGRKKALLEGNMTPQCLKKTAQHVACGFHV